ncbi:hypothetical protein RI835_003272 [Providencia rettgeri]|uniref:hypothetical protein n=2 Tax=Morganellaceae TaxID=1903414 RepID=UPI001EE6EA3D|nr:hypothetical protein [Providencia rettgeri]ELR5297213.1 hypothetical protein [Providencia rettgeri]MCG5386788.1 hypothetical protein [Providencia rettgeri]HEM6915987.1 hypothetical protein [Providencia stuartii]HEM7167496.1 hypothetical protein [Providencia stuartii]
MREYINSPFVPEQKSYWATHFCSIIECLHYHISLEESPRKLEHFPNWSMSDFRGNLPSNFFYYLKRWVKNWGFQYFIVNYLNQRIGNEVVDKLILNLSNEFDIVFSREFDKYWFYISGWDSELSKQLDSRFDKIFPEKVGLLSPNFTQVSRNSDLCLVLKNTKRDRNIGIFGEVEGNKGEKLTQSSFWNDKSDYCVFAIGVEKGSTKACYIDVFYHTGAPKINIIFEADHFVVKDFHRTINAIELLLNNGPRATFDALDEEFGFFINHLKMNWNKPSVSLLDFFYKFIDYNDYIGKVDGSLPFMSSIQAK